LLNGKLIKQRKCSYGKEADGEEAKGKRRWVMESNDYLIWKFPLKTKFLHPIVMSSVEYYCVRYLLSDLDVLSQQL
jgi:hypothetical protein